MSMNIKNKETHQLTEELAKLTGESLTAAVTEAVRERLDRVRQAQGINLADQLQVSAGFRTRLRDIGWTKSKVIGKHRAGTNFLKLVEYAENHTTKELEAYAAKKRPATDTRCVLLYFTPGEYRRYEEAVLKFGARKRGRGLIDKEKATIRMAKKLLAT